MPLVDYKTGEVSVFFYQAGCRVPPVKRGQPCVEPWPTWRVSSTDSGKTFSTPFNMSAVPGWGGISGGGKGVQLDSGRLVVACGNTTCYSDTHGKSWKRGAAAPLGPGVGGFGEEAVVADGRTPTSLALFIRSGSNGANGGKKSPLINHAVASSMDGGETYARQPQCHILVGSQFAYIRMSPFLCSWGPARLLPSVVGVTCQVRLTGTCSHASHFLIQI